MSQKSRQNKKGILLKLKSTEVDFSFNKIIELRAKIKQIDDVLNHPLILRKHQIQFARRSLHQYLQIHHGKLYEHHAKCDRRKIIKQMISGQT